MRTPKSEYVIFRVPPQTKALLESQWKESGKRNRSEWLRSLVESSVGQNKSTVSNFAGANGALVGTN